MAQTPTQALLAALVAQVDAALPALVFAAGLPPIVEVLSYWPSTPTPARAPQVFIDVSKSRRSDSRAQGAGLNKYAEDRTILVGVTSAGNDQQTVSNSINGYPDLIRQAVESVPSPAAQLWVRWISTDYSPGFAMGAGTYREAVLTFETVARHTYTKD